MLYFLIGLGIIVLILILFLYHLRKDEEEIQILDKNTSNSEADIIQQIKKSSIDQDLFKKGLSNLDIKEENFCNIKKEINKKIIWMEDFLNALLVNIFSQWHMLVEWVPGLAKTKTINVLSEVMDLDFKRIQFTPDMMPADAVWVEIFNSKTQDFEVKKWPVFTNILLADEINRTTPKVQSALLESMQEKQVSIWGKTYKLPNPFFVLATQNPIEQEWTYQLPEAQLDRFLFKSLVDYPMLQEEKKIIEFIQDEENISIQKIINQDSFFEILSNIKKVYMWEDIKDYISRIVVQTRKKDERILYWSSPRWTITLYQASKVLAYISGRDYVIHEDIQKLILLALRHRIVLTYDAKIDWYTEDNILIEILSKVSLE